MKDPNYLQEVDSNYEKGIEIPEMQRVDLSTRTRFGPTVEELIYGVAEDDFNPKFEE